MTHYEKLVDMNLKRNQHAQSFQKHFGTNIGKFWDVFTGLDVVKLDQFLRTPDGKSTREWIVETRGEDAAKLVEVLI